MGKTQNLNGAVFLKKNKDYSSVQEAQVYYEKFRMRELANTNFPESEYPEGFKELVIKLAKFNNPVQMNVWHNRKAILINQETGEKICTTWDNICSFQRRFQCAEMYQIVEILKRATPNEIFESTINEFDSWRNNLRKNGDDRMVCDEMVLEYFNEYAYPGIENKTNHIETVLFEIEEQLCYAERGRINANLKTMLQMPVTSNVVFIKGRERKM